MAGFVGRWPGAVGPNGFSHVVRYGPRSALGAAMVHSLLDAASHGPAGRPAVPDALAGPLL